MMLEEGSESAKIPVGEVLTDLWADLSASQKFIGVALVGLLAVSLLGSWWGTFRAWNEVRVYENQAIAAERERDEALEAAAKIATKIRVYEEELFKVEVKRDEKLIEVQRSDEDVKRDRAEYDRAVRQRLPNVPGTDELCAELAGMGYPCQPR